MPAFPQSLMRHGIKAVSDNLPDGAGIQVSGRELARLFGLEVVQMLQMSNKKNNEELHHAGSAIQTIQTQTSKPRSQRKAEPQGV